MRVSTLHVCIYATPNPTQRLEHFYWHVTLGAILLRGVTGQSAEKLGGETSSVN